MLEQFYQLGWTLDSAGGASGEAYMAEQDGQKLFLKRNSNPFIAALSAEGIVPKLVWTKRIETGEVVTPPVDDVTKHGPKAGEPEVTKEEIPFEKKREFNPDLKPGEEKVTQEGQTGEKTTTTPTTTPASTPNSSQ